MKKIILALAFIVSFSSIASAQQDSIPASSPDTIVSGKKGEDGGRNIKIIIGGDDERNVNKTVKTRWLMLDVGMSTYLHEGSLNMPSSLSAVEQRLLGSTQWNLRLVNQRVALAKLHKVNISYGVDLTFSKYKFDNNFTLNPDSEIVSFTDNPGVDFKKNHLNTTHLNVPLMLGFKLKGDKMRKSFNFKIGGYAGLLIASKTKQKVKGDNSIKVRDDFNLNKVNYGLSARFGYGAADFYINYGLNNLFQKEAENIYQLRPISFGVSIIPF